MLKVIMTTYAPSVDSARGDYAIACAEGLKRRLVLPDGDGWELILSNDGIEQWPYMTQIMRNLHGSVPVRVVCGPHGGIGASLNRALSCVGSDDLWMYITDDWLLTRELDLSQAMCLIRECDYHYVRLGPPHPNTNCWFRFQQDLGWWLQLDPSQGGYVFATRPFIATRNFYDTIGPFKEQCDAYVCERDYADRVNDQWLTASLAFTLPSLEGPWEHIGEEEVGDRYA